MNKLAFGQDLQIPSGYALNFVKRCRKEQPNLSPKDFITYVNNHQDRMYDIRPDTVTRYMRQGI